MVGRRRHPGAAPRPGPAAGHGLGRQAKNIALAWLRARDRTLTPGDPESCPGHCTLRTGKTTGMLSVNATTGQVWDHTWHGTCIATGRR
ncbi:hypothetical protein [Streptomyces sp. NPDC001100]